MFSLTTACKLNSWILTLSLSSYTLSYAFGTNKLTLWTFCLVISLARSKSLLAAFPSFLENSFANCYATTQCCSPFAHTSSLLFPISTHSWFDCDPDFTKSFLTICSFSGPGLFTQLVTLRDEVISPGGQGAGLLTACSKRGGFPKLSVSQLRLKPTAWIAVNWATSHYPNRTPGKENWSKHAGAHAACSAINNRILYLSPGTVAYCQHSWNTNRLTY